MNKGRARHHSRSEHPNSNVGYCKPTYGLTQVENPFLKASTDGRNESWPIDSVWTKSISETLATSTSIDLEKVPLVLVRGLPGSGKSTFARELARRGYRHFEADQFFIRRGVYIYDARQKTAAHAWCLDSTIRALAGGRRVVVSNTFVRKCEISPYLDLHTQTVVVHTNGPWKNVHNVPDAAVEKMRTEWESL